MSAKPYKDMHVKELVALLKSRNIKSNGKKKELVERSVSKEVVMI